MRWLRNQWIANNTASGRQKSRLRGFPWRCWRRSKTDGGGDGGQWEGPASASGMWPEGQTDKDFKTPRRDSEKEWWDYLHLSPFTECRVLGLGSWRKQVLDVSGQTDSGRSGTEPAFHVPCWTHGEAIALPLPYNHYTLKCFISEHCYQNGTSFYKPESVRESWNTSCVTVCCNKDTYGTQVIGTHIWYTYYKDTCNTHMIKTHIWYTYDKDICDKHKKRTHTNTFTWIPWHGPFGLLHVHY